MQKVSTLYGITENCVKKLLVFCNHFQTFWKSFVSEINVIVQIFYLHSLIGRYVTYVVRNDVTSKLKNKSFHKLKESGLFQNVLLFFNPLSD